MYFYSSWLQLANYISHEIVLCSRLVGWFNNENITGQQSLFFFSFLFLFPFNTLNNEENEFLIKF